MVQIHFSRANALAAYKADNMKDIARVHHAKTHRQCSVHRVTETNMRQAAEIVTHIMHETQLHLNYCQSFNISLPEILATEEHQGEYDPPPLCPSLML